MIDASPREFARIMGWGSGKAGGYNKVRRLMHAGIIPYRLDTGGRNFVIPVEAAKRKYEEWLNNQQEKRLNFARQPHKKPPQSDGAQKLLDFFRTNGKTAVK